MDILVQLQSSPLAWTILSIATILSVILAIFFGIKSIPRKTLKVSITDNELITNKQSNFSKLHILYDNKDVEKLSVTKVTFWSNSSTTINNTDIIEAAPLSIIAKMERSLELLY